MKQGWIKLYRKLQDNPLWLCEKFTRGQAWIDLLLLANHSDKYFYKRGIKIKVKKGQVGYSEIALSDRWQWSRNKVRKFLKELEKEQQIEQQKTNVTNLISIINWNSYQNGEQQIEQQTKQQAKQQKDTNKNVKNVKNFYNKETENLDNSQEAKLYRLFVIFLYGENELQRNLNKLLHMNDQITFERFQTLLNLSKQYNRSIKDVCLNLENHTKTYKSLYRTLQNWIKR